MGRLGVTRVPAERTLKNGWSAAVESGLDSIGRSCVATPGSRRAVGTDRGYVSVGRDAGAACTAGVVEAGGAGPGPDIATDVAEPEQAAGAESRGRLVWSCA